MIGAWTASFRFRRWGRNLALYGRVKTNVAATILQSIESGGGRADRLSPIAIPCMDSRYRSLKRRIALPANRAHASRIEAVRLIANTLSTHCVALFFILACPSTSAQPSPGGDAVALLKGTTRILTELSHGSATTIPDAILNRTQCILVIQAARTPLHSGTTACRETSDRWNNPVVVTFERKAGPTRAATLFIFVVSDAAVRALRSGLLEIQTYKYPVAPLAPKNAILDEHEVNTDVFTYEYMGGRLSGTRLHGIVRQSKSYGQQSADKDVPHASIKINKRYLSSLTSFFNTIVPSGIVIHHSAVLPDEDTPPRNERQIDKYHAARGFEITCFGHVYHVAYHYLILTNGRIQSGRPDRCEGAHAKGYNSYLGISVIGDFDSHDNPKGEKGPAKPNEKQLASLIRLCHRLMLRYHIPANHIVRHSDIAATKCPGNGFPFPAFLKELQRTHP